MKYTQQAIEKAIEGGWKPCGIITDYKKIILKPTNGGMWFCNDPEEDGCHFEWQAIVLMPDFWQSLGKSLGWLDGLPGVKPDWYTFWHRFIDHLAEGKDAESFFESLLTQNK